MEHGLKALLGCVQSAEQSLFSPSSGSDPAQLCMLEHVVLPVPDAGTHLVAVACKHCQQSVRIRVRSRGGASVRRWAAGLALTGCVCLWTAAAALLLRYFLTRYPAALPQEVALPGVLILIGIGLWAIVNPREAFAGDVGVGCTIDISREEQRRLRQIPRQDRWAVPRHVLLEPQLTHAEVDAVSWIPGTVVGELPPRMPPRGADSGTRDAHSGAARSA